MTFAEFDESTPRMVQLWINAYAERARERQQDLTIAAFHGVGFNCAANSETGLTSEHLERALGENAMPRDRELEFERRASAMSTFFAKIAAQAPTGGTN